MPAYHLPRVTAEARQKALRALDDALATPAGNPRPVAPLTPVQLLEISIIDDALDHLHAHQLPR